MTLAATGTATPSATERWRRLPLRWRAVVIALAAVIAIYFASSLVSGVYETPTTTPSGPSSSLDTSSEGTAALARLLAGEHDPVASLTVPLPDASLPRNGTLFVLDPAGSLTPSLGPLERFVSGGGRLVLGGEQPQSTVRALLGTAAAPLWEPGSSGTAHPVDAGPLNAGITTVLGGQSGAFRAPAPPGLSVVLLGPGGALALAASVGAGSVVLLASTVPLQNSQLAEADDAAFGLDLAGSPGTPVSFDEYDHGLGRAGTGLDGLPGHWKAALVLALLAALLWVWSAGRRFGPAQRGERELIPPRVAHVDAMASLLASGPVERAAEAAAPLREEARRRIRRRLRADADATDEQLATLAAVAADVPLGPETVARLLGTPRSAGELVAAGRAFVALENEEDGRS